MCVCVCTCGAGSEHLCPRRQRCRQQKQKRGRNKNKKTNRKAHKKRKAATATPTAAATEAASERAPATTINCQSVPLKKQLHRQHTSTHTLTDMSRYFGAALSCCSQKQDGRAAQQRVWPSCKSVAELQLRSRARASLSLSPYCSLCRSRSA